jgi:hypothetical protein
MYRGLANSAALYQARLRDRALDVTGIRTECYRPVIGTGSAPESAKDFYGDANPAYSYSNGPDSIVVDPKYDAYHQLLDIVGLDSEQTLPLEVIIKTCDHVPDRTLLRLPIRSKSDDTRQIWWVVQRTEVKHLETYYAKVAQCVPYRPTATETRPPD